MITSHLCLSKQNTSVDMVPKDALMFKLAVATGAEGDTIGMSHWPKWITEYIFRYRQCP